MKIPQKNRREGRVRIEVENEDDLWNLEPLISKGDKLRKLTQRTKLDGREKKTLRLDIEAEKIELQGERLRVTGEILQADDDVELGYHTFNIEPGDEFTLSREFSDSDWNELMEAEAQRSYKVLFVLVQKGEADLYLVRESGIQDLSKLSSNVPGKMYEDDTGGDFTSDLAAAVERSAKEVDHVIIGGPGFEKQKVMEELSEEVQGKAFLQDTSVTGRTGLNEAIKRGALEKVVKSSRIAEESSVLEELYEQLRKEGEADYGEPVKELAEMGAVEKLLITAERAREERKLLENVEQQGGEVVRVHTDHEPGERLEKLGGMAAILRYKP